MSAGLSLLQNFTPQAPTTEPLTSVPSSAGERMGAAWDVAQTPDRYWNIQAARRDKAQKIIDDYHGVTGERLRNPFDMAPTQEEIRENPGQPTTAIYAKRLETLRAKTAAARSNLPDLGGLPHDFLDADSIDQSIGSESGQARARDERLTGTGNGIPAFLSSAAGEMASPHGVMSMFLPVSRLPLAGAERIGAGWMRNIGKEALLQAALQAGVQIPASVIDYNTRAATSTQPTLGEVGHEVLAAGVGGAIFGGAFRASHLAIRQMLGHVDIPPAVKDAALVMESRELYGDKNALGAPAAAHEAAIDRAVQDVAAGRAAQVDDIVPNIRANPEDRLTPSEVNALPPSVRAMYKREQEILRVDPQTTDETAIAHAALERADAIATAATRDQPSAPVIPDERMQAIERNKEVLPALEAAAVNQDFPIEAREHYGRLAEAARQAIGRDEEAVKAFGPEVQRLGKMMDEPLPVTQPFTPPEEPGAGRPTEAGSPQDKTMDVQVRQLLEEGGGATPEHRRAYEAALQEEKEARIATGCVGGAL